jgi:hypothetical protein
MVCGTELVKLASTIPIPISIPIASSTATGNININDIRIGTKT